MRVWITGSQPAAERQAEALREHGHGAVVAPAIAVEPTGAASPQGRFDLVVFLSEHAVTHGGPFGYCRGARVLAVGAATAAALEAREISAEYPPVAGSEGLLELLGVPPAAGSARAALNRAGVLDRARVLIVAGEDGRKTLRDALRAAGSEVHEHLCYHRVAGAAAGPDPRTVDAILVASQDGFRHVARLWFRSGGPADVHVIAASERIAGLAPELGFQRVRVAGGASAADWLAALDVLGGGH